MSSAPALAATCDLSELVFPEKRLNISLRQHTIPVHVGGQLVFAPLQGSVFSIAETMYGKVITASGVIARIISSEAGPLPNEECGTRATLGSVEISTVSGSLVIAVPLLAEQWGCLIGIKAQLAQGTLRFKAVLAPKMDNSRVSFVSSVTHAGELESNIPQFDPGLTESINQALRDGTGRAADTVAAAIGRMQRQLDALQSEIDDPTKGITPIYHPRLQSIALTQEGGTLVLTQRRLAEAREGTSCAIRRLSLQKWEAAN
jgi:hypothetical protein